MEFEKFDKEVSYEWRKTKRRKISGLMVFLHLILWIVCASFSIFLLLLANNVIDSPFFIGGSGVMIVAGLFITNELRWVIILNEKKSEFYFKKMVELLPDKKE